MLNAASDLPENPALLKAMIAQLQIENAKLTTTLRAHDLVVQALRLQMGTPNNPGAISLKMIHCG
jgi:transposase